MSPSLDLFAYFMDFLSEPGSVRAGNPQRPSPGDVFNIVRWNRKPIGTEQKAIQ